MSRRRRPCRNSHPFFHPDRFRNRDLYVIDISPVPDRLEDSVGKRSARMFWTSLSEVVMRSIDLLFVANFQQLLVQGASALQVVSERLFDDHAAPVSFALFEEPLAPGSRR